MTEGVLTEPYAVSDRIVFEQMTTAASMTGNLIAGRNHQFPRRFIRAEGVMIGAGAAGDTVKIQKVTAAAVATDITDAVDVSAKGDKVVFAFGTMDDAQMDLNNGDYFQVVTASDALCMITITSLKIQATP